MVANVATIAMVKVWNGLNAPVRPLELCKVGDPYLVCDNQRGGKILVDTSPEMRITVETCQSQSRQKLLNNIGR